MSELRQLPGVDQILATPEFHALKVLFGTQAVRDTVRALQADISRQTTMPDWAKVAGGYEAPVQEALHASIYQPVFNLTGTIIHTNLGRALVSETLWQALTPLVTRPINLEYDLDKGSRGDRDKIIEDRLIRLTGCEAATVVNNNAAALLLVLNTLALGKKVPVSRGELIEIGGSFRLPELMARSGCQLVEVGTTNRTHLADYASVASEAALLLKVHPSNYHLSGFTKEVDAQSLAKLSDETGIPSCVDLGSGTLVNLAQWGLPKEPTPMQVLQQGIDVVTFSGDKLLGGVQAGIIVGKKELLEQIKRNPMKRALRADKIALAILEQTLKLYEDPERLAEALPLLKTLTLSTDVLEQRAAIVANALPQSWIHSIVAAEGQIGSGALPDKRLPSVCVVIESVDVSSNELIDRLRGLSTPVIGRVADGRVWLDMRGADLLDELVTTLSELA